MRAGRRRGARSLVALAAAAALTLAACGGEGSGEAANDGGEGSDAPQVHLVATEYEFSPSSLTAAAGSVTVHLENQGAIEHDFTIEGMDEISVHADPGQSASYDYELDAGTYTFYCSIPGHRETGMEGTLEVS